MRCTFIDVHTHVNLDAFTEDFERIAHATLREGVAHINVGTGQETSARAVELAERFGRGVYATAGLHPVRASGAHIADPEDTTEVFEVSVYRTLAEKKEVVAIGECGFDYYRVTKETKKKQEEAFVAQFELANELKKPLMLHIRDGAGNMSAYEDALALLKAHARVAGNVHFFAGTYEIARQFWNMGFTTSFTGVITFTGQYDDVVRQAPLDMIHAETDAPYVAPVPFRGRRNEPLHVREVYRRIAEIRAEDTETVRTALMKNAERVFSIVLP